MRRIIAPLASPQTCHRMSGQSERLAARARRGDRVARTRLVEDHMGLVRWVALRYRNRGLPPEDLVQEGAIGLLTAIDEFDPSRGAAFSTYAFWRIRAAITHALTARGQLIRVPRTVIEPARRPRIVSLDQPTPHGTPPSDLVSRDASASPETHAVEREQARLLREALSNLRTRKQTIVARHFGLTGRAETLGEIAHDLHLSTERTRAIKDDALRELAAELEAIAG